VEELKASNEELHAINEELRSATEELETSKEELQSVNEELTTLNHELKDKIDEVSRANSDLLNLMTSTDIGVIFLDRSLHIKRYTPRALELFNLIPSDLGRPLAHLTHHLAIDDLGDDAATVLRTLRVIERKVDSRDGRRFLLRVHPYRSVEDRIEGVVLTFLNITALQQAEDALRGREAMLRMAVRAAEAGGWELDGRTDRLQMTDECCALFGFDPAATLGLGDWIDRVDPADRDRVRAAVRRAADHREELDVEFRVHHPDKGVRQLWALGRGDGDGEERTVAGLTVDVTARRRES
jgi:two-component system CheB/CheR fusion protein